MEACGEGGGEGREVCWGVRKDEGGGGECGGEVGRGEDRQVGEEAEGEGGEEREDNKALHVVVAVVV